MHVVALILDASGRGGLGCNSASLNLNMWSMLGNGSGGVGWTHFKAHTVGIDSVWPVLKDSAQCLDAGQRHIQQSR